MAIFGLRAIQTFAHGVASLTDNEVVVEVRGQSAYTDGRKVVLPAEGFWNEGDFRSLCGVACHEIAHVWFQSTQQLPNLYKRFPKAKAARVQRAFNVVVDVADETRFERALPRAQALFAATRELVFAEAIASKALPGPTSPTLSEDQLLVLGIFWTRSHSRSTVGRQLRHRFRRVTGLKEVISILMKAREAKSRSAARFRPSRTAQQWKKLIGLSTQLIELLDRLYPSQSTDDDSDETNAGEIEQNSAKGTGSANSRDATAGNCRGSDNDGSFNQNSYPESGTTKVTANPMANWTNDALSKATARALQAADDGAIPDSFDWVDAVDNYQSGAISLPRARNTVAYRQECYDHVWPAFKRVAKNLILGPTICREDGFMSGGRLGRPYRALIDGRCFQRVSRDEGPDVAISVVFDLSESMAHCLSVFLPVGAALVDALNAVPEIQVAMWRFGSYVERVHQTSELRLSRTMGGTSTHLAMQAAMNWLETESALRKAVILFTDGAPGDVAATSESVVTLQRKGAVLLVGSIGLSESQCALSMPGGVVFTVDPANSASSLHVAANKLRRLQ